MNPEVARRERITHTTRVGRLVQQIDFADECEVKPISLECGLIRTHMYWLHKEECLRGLPEWFGSVRDFLTGVAHLAALTRYTTPPYCGPDDNDGIVWDDVHYVLAQHSSPSRPLPELPSTSTLYISAQSRECGRPYTVPYPLLLFTALYDIESYPDDVDPVAIGLGKIVTGKYTPDDNLTVAAMQYLIHQYMERASLRRCDVYPGGRRNLAEFLRDNVPSSVISKCVTSLSHWASIPRKHTKVVTWALEFLDALQALPETERLYRPYRVWTIESGRRGEIGVLS